MAYDEANHLYDLLPVKVAVVFGTLLQWERSYFILLSPMTANARAFGILSTGSGPRKLAADAFPTKAGEQVLAPIPD